jgi:hypothetical protein
MMVNTVNIAAGDYTSGIQKRQIGKRNIGFYCDCGEFVAFGVTDPRASNQIAFACDGPIEFLCPFCNQKQKRIVSEFKDLILTEGNKRIRPHSGQSH